MKHRTIGIMGALICNENLGCVALSYSLLLLMETIRKETGVDFDYIIFEDHYDLKKYEKLADVLQVDIEKLHQTPIADFNNSNWKVLLKNIGKRFTMKQMIKSCDLIIDITRGDSFTDIYGLNRFWKLTRVKKVVETLKIPLILAPQTYGPFQNESVKKFARNVIDDSYFVMSRDKASANYLQSFCDKKVFVTTDLAFGLPYTKRVKDNKGRIKVGINPSGLLVSKKSEGTQLKVDLVTDYDSYISNLIEYLLNSGKYEIHLIPHVGDDAVHLFEKPDENIIVHHAFENPIEAKNCISQMDIFVGSRMHATIGALSSGVVTIPVAYSRKFAGLFDDLEYYHTIDLCSLNTNEALNDTIAEIENYEDMTNDVANAVKRIKEQYRQLYQVLSSKVQDILDI